jgi:hypothetical protein
MATYSISKRRVVHHTHHGLVDGGANGEVIDYDTINKYYKIRFKDGYLEDFDKKNMKQYYKQNQHYSGTKYRDMAKAFSTHRYKNTPSPRN